MFKYRILVVDDNRAIHQDFRKILAPAARDDDALAESELALFGAATGKHETSSYEISYATQSDEALQMVQQACADNRPYAVAFIDVRMPPGNDGIETTARIWECDPEVQVVICTAYSDYSWKQMVGKLGHSDRLMILKKPFDNIEVLQLADGLTHKWEFARRTRRRMEQLEQLLQRRTQQLTDSTTRLDAATARLRLSDNQTESNASAQHQRSALESKLKYALENGEISVHYQPLFDVATRQIVSLEALLRWQHGEQMISPAEFIPLAEESGLIIELGKFVLRKVCEQAMQWQREQVPVVPIAVNISAVQLQDRQLVSSVRSVLQDTGMPAELLVLELTESAFIKDTHLYVDDLKELRRDGIQIEIDDFGTGYSSLSYLRRLPIDTLKIDRSFIKDVDTNPIDESIVHAILTMARTLGLKVVAEGVETASQLEVLCSHHCEMAQGFYFARPMCADACRRLLLELAKRPTFTETLRMRLATDGPQPPRAALGK